jgi:hypothetical protein
MSNVTPKSRGKRSQIITYTMPWASIVKAGV